MSQLQICPSCKRRVEAVDEHCPVCKSSLSVADAMMEQASVPDLASLFKQAKAAGHIKAGFQYGNST